MKQSKRMLSVILALIMICSTFTIGAQALKADITKPAGYDEVLEPVITSEQAACFLLDELEPIFADIDVYEQIQFIETLTIDLRSIDGLLSTIQELNSSDLLNVAEALFDAGDIEHLNLGAGKIVDSKGNRCRRSNATSSDFEVLSAVLSFVESNAEYIAKFAYNGFDFGDLESFAGRHIIGKEDIAALSDVRGLVVSLVESLLSGTDFEVDIKTTYHNSNTLDGLLQSFIDNKLVKLIVDLCASSDGTNQVAEILGLTKYIAEDGTLTQEIPTTTVFPSLTDGEGKLGKLDLNTDSTYNFFIKIFKALIQDIVIPYAGQLLGDLLDEETASYIDIALPILNIDVTFPEDCTPREKVDILLNYLLVGEGKTQFICFKEAVSPSGVAVKYLGFADGFWAQLCDIIMTVLPMLPALLGDDAPNIEKTDAELSEMTTNEFLTYVAQVCLEKFVDGVDFATDCKSIRELASRTLIEVCKDLMPEKNFEEMFDSHQREYDSDDCLWLAAFVIRYYLNGETTIQDTTSDENMSFSSILNTAADWVLDKFGALLGYKKSNYAGYDQGVVVWHKLYDTVFQVIPLNIFCGATDVSVSGKTVYKPGVPDSAEGLKDLIMEDIVGGVLEFNIDDTVDGITGLNKVLSLIGRRDDSDLNKPIPQLIMDLLGRIINPLFGLPTEKNSSPSNDINLIIPYSYTKLDQLITANNNITSLSLTNTLYRLCVNLPYIHKTNTSLIYTAAPLITNLMGLWGGDSGKVRFPFIEDVAPATFNNGVQFNIETLTALYNRYADSSNEGLSYDDDNYSYFHMVDFAPFLYLKFKSARSDIKSLIDSYNSGKADTATFRIDATNAAYRFLTITRFLEQGYNWDKSVEADENNYDFKGETVACDNQLNKEIIKANAAQYAQEEYPDGSKKYTERTWAAYEKAIAFANKVEGEYKAITESTTLKDSEKEKALRDMRQSRINTARKELVDAVKNLKPWIPLADYSALDAIFENMSYNISLRNYNQAFVNKVIEIYKEAEALDRDYDQDNQVIIDRMVEELQEALDDADTHLIDSLVLNNEGVQFIDERYSYLYGLEEGFATDSQLEIWAGGSFNDYMMMLYGYGATGEGDYLELDIESTRFGNGTGSLIYLAGYNEETGEYDRILTDTVYTTIVFGDVDGDSFSDACDNIYLRAYLSYKLTKAQIGSAALYAADVNRQDGVTGTDAKMFNDSGIKKTVINQAPDDLTEMTFGYYDVMGIR